MRLVPWKKFVFAEVWYFPFIAVAGNEPTELTSPPVRPRDDVDRLSRLTVIEAGELRLVTHLVVDLDFVDDVRREIPQGDHRIVGEESFAVDEDLCDRLALCGDNVVLNGHSRQFGQEVFRGSIDAQFERFRIELNSVADLDNGRGLSLDKVFTHLDRNLGHRQRPKIDASAFNRQPLEHLRETYKGDFQQIRSLGQIGEIKLAIRARESESLVRRVSDTCESNVGAVQRSARHTVDDGGGKPRLLPQRNCSEECRKEKQSSNSHHRVSDLFGGGLNSSSTSGKCCKFNFFIEFKRGLVTFRHRVPGPHPARGLHGLF